MKNAIKKRLIYIMTLVLTFVTITNAYCVPAKADVFTDANEAVGALGRLIGVNSDVEENILREAFWQTIIPSGYIISPVIKAEGELMRKAWAKALNRKYGNSDKTASNLTQSDLNEIAQDFYQNISVTNNNITYNDNSKALLMDYIEEVENRTPYSYWYSRDISNLAMYFNYGPAFNKVRDLIRSKQDNFYCLYSSSSTDAVNAKYMFWFVPKNTDAQFVRYTGAWDAKKVGIASYQNWTWIVYQNGGTVSCNQYVLNDGSLVFEQYPNKHVDGISFIGYEVPDSTGWTTNGATNTNPCFLLNVDRHEQVLIWNTLNDMKQGSIGQQPYYISDSFNNFKNMSTSYTIDNSNVNKITYGDITSYVNNYYGTTGDYPTQPLIDIYINNNIPDADPTPTPNPDNPNNPNTGGGSNTVSGNGSSAATANATANATNGNVNVTINNNPSISFGWGGLSGNSVSGNGTVSGNVVSNGVGDIFSFLSGIGQSLASLVKNLGKALTELLDALISIIDDILVKIPNVLSGLLEIVFGGLPDEIKAVILMGIVLMVTFGIIKVIRG